MILLGVRDHFKNLSYTHNNKLNGASFTFDFIFIFLKKNHTLKKNKKIVDKKLGMSDGRFPMSKL